MITKEEEQFNKTIDQGLSILAGMEEEMVKKGQKVLSGREAFRLYDTYGFPVDLTIEILGEKGLSIDEEGFKKAVEEQKAKAKNAPVQEPAPVQPAPEPAVQDIAPQLDDTELIAVIAAAIAAAEGTLAADGFVVRSIKRRK